RTAPLLWLPQRDEACLAYSNSLQHQPLPHCGSLIWSASLEPSQRDLGSLPENVSDVGVRLLDAAGHLSSSAGCAGSREICAKPAKGQSLSPRRISRKTNRMNKEQKRECQ